MKYALASHRSVKNMQIMAIMVKIKDRENELELNRIAKIN